MTEDKNAHEQEAVISTASCRLRVKKPEQPTYAEENI